MRREFAPLSDGPAAHALALSMRAFTSLIFGAQFPCSRIGFAETLHPLPVTVPETPALSWGLGRGVQPNPNQRRRVPRQSPGSARVPASNRRQLLSSLTPTSSLLFCSPGALPSQMSGEAATTSANPRCPIASALALQERVTPSACSAWRRRRQSPARSSPYIPSWFSPACRSTATSCVRVPSNPADSPRTARLPRSPRAAACTEARAGTDLPPAGGAARGERRAAALAEAQTGVVPGAAGVAARGERGPTRTAETGARADGSPAARAGHGDLARRE